MFNITLLLGDLLNAQDKKKRGLNARANCTWCWKGEHKRNSRLGREVHLKGKDPDSDRKKRWWDLDAKKATDVKELKHWNVPQSFYSKSVTLWQIQNIAGEVQVCKHTPRDRAWWDLTWQDFEFISLWYADDRGGKKKAAEICLRVIGTLCVCRFIYVSLHLCVVVSVFCVCVCVCVCKHACFLRMLHPHNSLSLFPRQLLREQLSGTDCCCKVSSPPDQAIHHATQHHLSSHQVNTHYHL